jgi:hypothetical protein
MDKIYQFLSVYDYRNWIAILLAFIGFSLLGFIIRLVEHQLKLVDSYGLYSVGFLIVFLHLMSLFLGCMESFAFKVSSA